jgi:hypothetical protein
MVSLKNVIKNVRVIRFFFSMPSVYLPQKGKKFTKIEVLSCKNKTLFSNSLKLNVLQGFYVGKNGKQITFSQAS